MKMISSVSLTFVVVFIFCVLFSQVFTYGPVNQASTCITPENIAGYCVPMAHCQRISSLLRTFPSPPFPPHVTNYVQRSHCGTIGYTHYGCCAASEISVPFNLNANPYNYATWNPYQPTTQTQQQPPNYYFQPQVASANYAENVLNSMQCGSYSGERISNGETVRLSEFPWMALLEYDVRKSRSRFLCSGTLITDRYVLTAAHCVNGINELISVRLGEHNLKQNQDCEVRYVKADYTDQYCAPPYVDVGVERIISHPQYSALDMSSDIALIRLVSSVPLQSHIKPICLPRMNYVRGTLPEMLIISGWGVTERGYASDVLMKALIPLRTPDVCQNVFRRSLQTRQNYFCAGGLERRSTCRGDSGGPLFAPVYYGSNIRYVQFGIISSGEYSCGSKHNTPGVYTSVAAYMPWILSQMQP